MVYGPFHWSCREDTRKRAQRQRGMATANFASVITQTLCRGADPAGISPSTVPWLRRGGCAPFLRTVATPRTVRRSKRRCHPADHRHRLTSVALECVAACDAAWVGCVAVCTPACGWLRGCLRNIRRNASRRSASAHQRGRGTHGCDAGVITSTDAVVTASHHRITNRPQLLQLISEDTALVAMVNLPMVRRAEASHCFALQTLDAVADHDPSRRWPRRSSPSRRAT